MGGPSRLRQRPRRAQSGRLLFDLEAEWDPTLMGTLH
jgi:hypothetical protein